MDKVTAYINAGGQGTRLQDIFKPDPNKGLAKALLEVGSPPIKLVDHHITKLRRAGIGNIVVGAAHQDSVASYVQERYGELDGIVAATTDRQLGTAAELLAAHNNRPDIFGAYIYVCNVDTVLDISEADFLRFHKIGGKAVSIALTKRTGVPNEGAFLLDENRHVVYSTEASSNPIGLDEAESRTVDRGSSTGSVIINTPYLSSFTPPSQPKTEVSLYRHFISAALHDAQLAGYDNGIKFFTDVGTVQTWTSAQQTGSLQEHLEYPHDDTETEG